MAGVIIAVVVAAAAAVIMILYRGGACECQCVYFTENRGLLLTIGPCPYGYDNGY